MLTPATFIQDNFGSPRRGNMRGKKKEKMIKRLQIGNEVKLSLSADDMIIKPKEIH